MPNTPDDILEALGVPFHRTRRQLAELVAVDPAALSKPPDGTVTWRVLGLAADILEGVVGGSSHLVEGTAWTRAVLLAQRIRELDSKDTPFNEASLSELIFNMGLTQHPEAAVASRFILNGARTRFASGGWALVQEWLRSIVS